NTKLRILILEDQMNDVELVVRTLRRSGIDFIYKNIASAKEFISTLENESWDVILADYNMPQFNAPEALKLLNEKGIDIPFIVVSGTIGEQHAVDIMKTGADDYVMKDNLARLGPAVEQERAVEALLERDRNYREAITQANAVPYQRNYITDKFLFFGEGIKELTGY